MLEMLLSPKRAERNSWSMFFVGFFYAALSVLLVNWIFAQDVVLAKYSGILVVTFSVMFTMPFVYHMLKYEEEKDKKYDGMWKMLKEHSKALWAMLFLFLGFVVAFSFLYTILSSTQSFKAQIETYCSINRPNGIEDCVAQYGVKGGKTTAFITARERLFMIFANNVYVLIFTLVFSLIFGAGGIFVLAWNASVIAAAVGIFTKSDLSALPLGISRYMIHGIPEIAAYFIALIAGGIISTAVVRHEIHEEKFWSIMQDSLNLIILAVIILFLAALMEVFITPALF
jgi:uncharacterized membrane protein SpoIIM required for sporulation